MFLSCRPVDNVVITTKGLQDRNIHLLDGTTVENEGKLILTETSHRCKSMILKSIHLFCPIIIIPLVFQYVLMMELWLGWKEVGKQRKRWCDVFRCHLGAYDLGQPQIYKSGKKLQIFKTYHCLGNGWLRTSFVAIV